MSSARPLEGIQVIDLSELAPGPFLTRILTDLGAEVIKVERPQGDLARIMAPGTFEVLADGKKLETVDLKDPAGLAGVKELLAAADLLVEGFRPGVLERLGLGPDVLAELNPRLIQVSISGFGRSGPNVKAAGHDINYQAMAGLLALGGGLDQPPALGQGVPIADLMGALYATIATLAALEQRHRTGRGQHLDVAITDAAMHAMNLQLGQYELDGVTDLTEIRRRAFTKPGYGAFPTSDGRWVSIASIEQHFWDRLVEAFGLAESLKGAPHKDRVKRNAEINEHVARRTATMTAREVVDALTAVDVPVAEVVNPAELTESEQATARGLVARTQANGLAYIRFPVAFEEETDREL